MKRDIKRAIIQTLLYSDIFAYPLTKEQLWQFLITKKKVSKKSFEETLSKKILAVSVQNGLYFLKGRDRIFKKRMQRREESKKKLYDAHRIVSFLSFVPTLRFIGVSGALALENAKKDDDIDLFIITQKNSVWLTRLLVLFLLQFLGKRRKRADVHASGKICCNMFISEEKLTFPKDRQDMFTAHEIAQLKPMLDRNNTYKKFIVKNKWVLQFMPNSIDSIDSKILRYKDTKKKSPNILISQYLNIFEVIAKQVQLRYMKGLITKETITDSFLAFHPYDYRSVILKRYNQRLKKYNL